MIFNILDLITTLYSYKKSDNIIFMFKQKIFIFSFIVLCIVAVFNNLGNNYNLYEIYSWYDIPMHLLGGLWVSLFSLFLYPHINKRFSIANSHMGVFVMIFFILLFITVSWEIFELVGGMMSLNDPGYWPDTLGDIMNGFIGGILGYFYWYWTKMCRDNLEVPVLINK